MTATRRLVELGQSPWYDNLTRDFARGGLQALIDDGIRGVTSNPTIFESAMAEGDAYDEQIAEPRRAGADVNDIYWSLVVDDVGHAADLLRPTYDATGGGDGFVSLEVDPDLARDTNRTVRQALDLFRRLGRENVMIKIPATVQGLSAITKCIASGLNVNVTLIFSLARYDAVIDAYLQGLEAVVGRGDDVSRIASVASFFVSRVDTEADRRLPEDSPLRGQAAVANARLAYRLFEQRFSGERWQALQAQGARVQRPLWASTSTKNPAYSPAIYIENLIGPNTVNTLAPASIEVLRDLDPTALRADTVRSGVEEAEALIGDLAAAGVDIDDVTATLEREGVEKFSASFHDALETLAKKAEELSG